MAGDLDASTFESVIECGRELYQSGVRTLLLDLRAVWHMGSSGLVALHSVTLILQGRQPPDPEYGWSAFHAIEATVAAGPQPNIKILGPRPSVLCALERSGMTQVIDIHVDEQMALDSFWRPPWRQASAVRGFSADHEARAGTN